MRFLFCDDDATFLSELEEAIKKVLQKQGKEADLIFYTSGKQLLKDFKQNEEKQEYRVDAVFLDIDMPEKDGFQVAEAIIRLENPPAVIFVSHMEHLVFQAFSYSPLWFLTKSDLSPLEQIFDKLEVRAAMDQRLFSFQFKGKKIWIKINDIIYFESNGHYLTLFTGKEQYRFKGSIGEMERELKKHHFIRCHVGFLVNCQYISMIDSDEIKLRHGFRLPLSRNRKKLVQEEFANYVWNVKG